MIGFIATQINKGSYNRGKGKSAPTNKNILARMLLRFTQSEVNGILDKTVQTLSKKRFLKEKTFILDAMEYSE